MSSALVKGVLRERVDCLEGVDKPHPTQPPSLVTADRQGLPTHSPEAGVPTPAPGDRMGWGRL